MWRCPFGSGGNRVSTYAWRPDLRSSVIIVRMKSTDGLFCSVLRPSIIQKGIMPPLRSWIAVCIGSAAKAADTRSAVARLGTIRAHARRGANAERTERIDDVTIGGQHRRSRPRHAVVRRLAVRP